MNNTRCVLGFLECCLRTGFNCLIPTHSISSDPHYKLHSHHIFFSLSLSFPFSCFISLLHLSHPSTLVVSDLVSSAVDGVLVSGCDVMVVAAALMELAKWISRGIQRALSLITDPSAKVKSITVCPQNDWFLRIFSIYLLTLLCVVFFSFSVWTSQIFTLFCVKAAAISHPFIYNQSIS